jgi:hypothetical protein
MLSAHFADRSSTERKLQQWPKQREDDGDTYWLCVHPHQLLYVQNRSAVTDRHESMRTGKIKFLSHLHVTILTSTEASRFHHTSNLQKKPCKIINKTEIRKWNSHRI